MGAATSVENSFNVKYMKPLLWEYEASKAVMEPNKARKNIVDFLTSGKYPFSEEQMVKIKSAYGSCEAEIREKEQVFHQHWQKIVVEEGGSAFRTHTHTRDTGDSRGGAMGMLGMEMDGPMGVGGLICMDIGVTQDHTVSEIAPAPAVDDHEAMQMVNSTCDRLQFANQLPAYMESVSGDPLIIQIGLKMSDRLKLLEKYEEDWADLLQTSEVVEAQCKDIVAECLQELSLSLAKEQSEEQEEGDEVCTDITWGVSLKFLKDFLAAHPEIDADYTTGSVVYNIIIPETAAAQETYVRAHLLRQPEQHKHLSDLRGGFRRVVVPPQQRGMGMAPDEVTLTLMLPLLLPLLPPCCPPAVDAIATASTATDAASATATAGTSILVLPLASQNRYTVATTLTTAGSCHTPITSLSPRAYTYIYTYICTHCLPYTYTVRTVCLSLARVEHVLPKTGGDCGPGRGDRPRQQNKQQW